MPEYSKQAQLARSPGGNRRCSTTGVGKGVCTCRSCVGRRNQRKGKTTQRKVRKELALRTEKFVGRTGNEEHWHASRLRFEVKAGKQVEPIAVRYLRARQQSDAAKSIGDTRPFVMAAVPDGSQTLLVIRADEIRAVVDAFCEEWA